MAALSSVAALFVLVLELPRQDLDPVQGVAMAAVSAAEGPAFFARALCSKRHQLQRDVHVAMSGAKRDAKKAARLRNREQQKLRMQNRAPPPGAEAIADPDFLRRLHNSGPVQLSQDVPAIDPTWAESDPGSLSRKVVEALCAHRFGESVSPETRSKGESSRGKQVLVTLDLTSKDVLGSCLDGQIHSFDKATGYMMDILRETDESLLKPLLKVQTPGAEPVLSVEELWKCQVFPCSVRWRVEDSVFNRYLSLVGNSTTEWQLAATMANYGKSGRLTKEQMEVRYNIEHSQLESVTLHLDGRSQRRLRIVRQALREAQKELAREEEAGPPGPEVLRVGAVRAQEALGILRRFVDEAGQEAGDEDDEEEDEDADEDESESESSDDDWLEESPPEEEPEGETRSFRMAGQGGKS